MSDDLAVDDHCFRILGVKEIAVKGLVVVVNYGKSGTGSVRGYHRRNDHHRKMLIVGRGLCRIDCGTAAYAHYHVDVVFLYQFFHPFYLADAGNAAEDLVLPVVILPLKTFFDLVMAGLITAMGTYKQPPISQVLHFLVKMQQSVLSLHIFLWRTHHS